MLHSMLCFFEIFLWTQQKALPQEFIGWGYSLMDGFIKKIRIYGKKFVIAIVKVYEIVTSFH